MQHIKKLTTVLSFFLFCNLDAQDAPRTCGTPELPQQFETWVQSITPVPGKYGTNNTQSIFNIPVIVHVLHNNEAVNAPSATSGNNLNAAQINDQITILNKDFNGTNSDTNLIPAVFKPLLGKFQVNFCMAVVNPTGGILAEPGIDRVNRVAKGWTGFPYGQTYMDGTVKANTIWDPNRYLNIWVVPLTSGLLGYATFPNPGTTGIPGLSGPFGGATTDGVVITTRSFGSIGNVQAPYNKGRTTTHEIGHWMGLRHIWGDSNCGNDFCNDTPPAQNSNSGCPVFPYKKNVCPGNTTGEMTMNYMDYSSDACMYMFTADQKFRAQLILANSPIRSALITSTVCNLPTIGNDVGITHVSQPTYSQTFSCASVITPVVNLKNYGSTVLTSAVLNFNLNGANAQTMNWTGSVAPNATFAVTLPQLNGLVLGMNALNVSVTSPNGVADNNLSNNNNNQQFALNNPGFTAASTALCLGNAVTLTASGATSYSWSTGATTSTISVNPSSTTVYTVTGTSGFCNMARTVTVTVETTPAISLDKQSVCEGKPSVITANGASSYTWSSGATTSSINVTLSSSASYTVSAATSAGCSVTQAFNIQVSPVPTVAASASHVSCGSCADATITALGAAGTAPYTYSWMPGNKTGATVNNVAAGCYTVTATDANGCAAKEEVCVSFDTGILNYKTSGTSMKVAPNPGKGVFNVEFGSEASRKIEVIDALGRSIKKMETSSNEVTLDLEQYPDGLYYVLVRTASSSATVKLVKRG